MSINPNADFCAVFEQTDLSDENQFPRFIKSAEFDQFRHIPNLKVEFQHPVTVVSGTNKSGKTTILLSIACSHFEFKKRNYTSGKLERQTWSDVLKFTNHDSQTTDWTYFLDIKSGSKVETKRGQRKFQTKKWNGLGKKESQIQGVNVVYLDLDRILPARHHSPVLHKRAKTSVGTAISKKNQNLIEECFSYVLEESYSIKKLADHMGHDLFGFSASNSYSSFNSASGEDVLSRILIDCVEAPKKALILIDELELGLHPHVQRRLMDVIVHISSEHQKQFIITSHSSTVISSVPESARIFIESISAATRSISPISINAALSKMDSVNYPLVDVFCEDETSKWIIQKVLSVLDSKNYPGINSQLIDIICSGSAHDTYQNFIVRDRIFGFVKVKSGHACILDGDMKSKFTKKGQREFPDGIGLHFLPGDRSPEHFLCDIYEKQNKNKNFRYHVTNSNPHCLFNQMISIYGCADKRSAFEACWTEFQRLPTSASVIDDLVDFLHAQCLRFSPNL